MTDHTAGDGHGMGGAHHAQRTPKAEFYLYFGLIFLIAIPFAAVAWAWCQLAIERPKLAGAWAAGPRLEVRPGRSRPAIFRP
jgi:hypothetical protein